MVKLNKIYTRTGDDGTTGLISGPRRKKFDLRINAYGTVDEANSQIGKIRTLTANKPIIDAGLARIQNDLFDLGSDLANPQTKPMIDLSANNELRICKEQIVWLEEQIDYFNEKLQPLNSFVLPGGTVLAAEFHLGRAITRRAERIVAELIDVEPFTNPLSMHYLNRLSDLLFVLARISNNEGKNDNLWKPGQFIKKE